jgi:GNAT superfamily N-acetyltransferase
MQPGGFRVCNGWNRYKPGIHPVGKARQAPAADGAQGRTPPGSGHRPAVIRHAWDMAVHIDASLEGIDWQRVKADLSADDFDNGRSPEALRISFAQSQHVAIARDGDHVVAMARLLSDGVCNAYLLDVWTLSAYRRRGIASGVVRHLMARVPGQHVGLQTDHAAPFYARLGFRPQPQFLSVIAGTWPGNDASRHGATRRDT